MLRSFRARLLAGFAIVVALTLFLSASGFVLLLREQQADYYNCLMRMDEGVGRLLAFSAGAGTMFRAGSSEVKR